MASRRDKPTKPNSDLDALRVKLVGHWREVLVEEFVRFAADLTWNQPVPAEIQHELDKIGESELALTYEEFVQRELKLKREFIDDIVMHLRSDGTMRYCIDSIREHEESEEGEWDVDEKDGQIRLVFKCGGRRVSELKSVTDKSFDLIARRNRKVVAMKRMERLVDVPSWAKDV